MINSNKDRKAIMEAVEKDGKALQYASEELKNDKEVVIKAIKQNTEALLYANPELLKDEDVLIAAITQRPSILKHISPKREDYEGLVLKLVKSNGEVLKYASKELCNNKDIVMEAVKNNGEALQYASEELRNNETIVREAIRLDKYINIYDYDYDEFGNEMEYECDYEKIPFMTHVLEYVGESLKNDKMFISQCITENPESMKYASDKIKGDKETIKELIDLDNADNLSEWEYINLQEKRSEIVKYVPETIRNDTEYIAQCMKINPYVFRSAGIEAQEQISEKIDRYVAMKNNVDYNDYLIYKTIKQKVEKLSFTITGQYLFPEGRANSELIEYINQEIEKENQQLDQKSNEEESR